MTKIEQIFVKGVRILRPDEYDKLLNAIPKDHHKTIFEVLFWSGMRYAEIRRFHNHPEWYMKESKAIALLGSTGAQKKAKRKFEDRYITPIPPQLESILRFFQKDQVPPSLRAWDYNLKRWGELAGIGPEGLSAKTTRKSIESWMIAGGCDPFKICLRQGHDSVTAIRHYVGIPFSPGEKEEIKRRLSWCL